MSHWLTIGSLTLAVLAALAISACIILTGRDSEDTDHARRRRALGRAASRVRAQSPAPTVRLRGPSGGYLFAQEGALHIEGLLAVGWRLVQDDEWPTLDGRGNVRMRRLGSVSALQRCNPERKVHYFADGGEGKRCECGEKLPGMFEGIAPRQPDLRGWGYGEPGVGGEEYSEQELARMRAQQELGGDAA